MDIGLMVFRRLYWNHKLNKWHRKKISKLQSADVVVLRYPKSGVTWLRVMISRIYQQRTGRAVSHLIGSNEFAAALPDAPKLLIANENMGVENDAVKAMIADCKVIMLVRDPRDVAVSLFFHFSKRATKLEYLSYRIPENVSEMSLYSFMMHPEFGLANIIGYMNYWAEALKDVPSAIIVRYEDLRLAPHASLQKVMNVLSPETATGEIADAVDFSDFERMKSKEGQGGFSVSILKPANESDLDSFKVRRGKVGGYVDYLDEAECSAIDRMVAERLDPFFAYT
jgi:hypothetical protein